jgi:class 3 adenylate cyclase
MRRCAQGALLTGSMRNDRLRCRIGLARGLVVLGNLPSDQRGAPSDLGEASDVTAHLLVLAAPGAMVIPEGCRRLARGVFDYKTLPPMPVEDAGRSVPVLEVIGEAIIESRFEHCTTASLSRWSGARTNWRC